MKFFKSKVRFALFFLVLGFFISDFAVFSQKIQKNTEEEKIILESQKKFEPVDVIIVLTGAQGRIREALWLFEQGRSSYLFISGVEADSTVDTILAVNSRSDFPQNLKERILLDYISKNTEENAQEIAKLLEDKSWRSFLLVTSSYHLPRAQELVRRELLKRGINNHSLLSHSVESKNFESHNWWKKNSGWVLMLTEYVKMKSTQLRSLFY